MHPFADVVVLLWLSAHAGTATAASATADAPLRTFVVPKDPAARGDENTELLRELHTIAPHPPEAASSHLSGLAGLGYVQHADWGAEVGAAGAIGGLDLQLDSLITYGNQGAQFDHGTASLADPMRNWRVDAGDLFSDLRGPVRGGRFTWRVTNRWQPSLAIDTPRPGSLDQRTLLVYHDGFRAGPVGVDGELAQDKSFFLRSRLSTLKRFDVETSYRRGFAPVELRDAGVQIGFRMWKNVSVSAGTFRSDRPADRNDWRTFAVHVPLSHLFGLTLERAFTHTSQSSDVLSAAMVDVHAGSLLFFHRYQWGRSDFLDPGLGPLDREQLQSMASYSVSPRVHFTVQMASQWLAADRAENWLEWQSDVRLTRRTNLQVAVPLVGSFDAGRVRVRLDQGLPNRFSVFAEYGRPSSYQSIEIGAEQPRFKLMLRRSWTVATPSPSGDIRGQVIDYIGRPVAGARVRLGPYSVDADVDGNYVFSHLPRGEFDLSLDPDLLPADYAWDGRSRRVSVTPSTHAIVDLVVAPLNAIHGRVFVDKNGNGRFDPGEGVAGAVVMLEDRVTATDADGAYDFYNVLPGPHTVRLDAARLPAAFESKAASSLAVELRDDRPVTGVDFVVVARVKPVVWKEIHR
jgi:hypothetical protein